MIEPIDGKQQSATWEVLDPDSLSREIQNATDQVTEPVNIAEAYDRYRSLNTQWNSSVLLEEKHSGLF